MNPAKLAIAVALPIAVAAAIAYGASPSEQDRVAPKQLTAAEALDNGEYKVLAFRDIQELSKPTLQRINWEEGSDLTDLMTADLTIGLNKMAETGWTLAFIEAARSASSGDGARINYPTMYIFKKSE